MNKIFCCQSLEHLRQDELVDAVKNFKKMNPEKVVVATSTDNFLSEIGIKFIRSVKDSHDTHYVNYEQIHEVMGKYFKLKRKKNIYIFNIISEWH